MRNYKPACVRCGIPLNLIEHQIVFNMSDICCVNCRHFVLAFWPDIPEQWPKKWYGGWAYTKNNHGILWTYDRGEIVQAEQPTKRE